MANSRLHKLHCQPADDMLDCKGRLSDTIAPNTLAEVNKEVKLAATIAESMELELLCDDLAES